MCSRNQFEQFPPPRVFYPLYFDTHPNCPGSGIPCRILDPFSQFFFCEQPSLFHSLSKERKSSLLLSTRCALFTKNNRGVPQLVPIWNSPEPTLLTPRPGLRLSSVLQFFLWRDHPC